MENGRDSCRGAISESPTGSHQKFIVPGQGLPLGIASHCPRPSGAGEEAGGRAGWGLRGGIYEFRRLRGGGEPPPRSPPPRAMPTTVHCLGEPGDTPRPPDPTWGFNRACTSPIANPERSAPCGKFAPMGPAPLPCLTQGGTRPSPPRPSPEGAEAVPGRIPGEICAWKCDEQNPVSI